MQDANGLQGIWFVQEIDAHSLATCRDDVCQITPLEFGHPTQIEYNPGLDPSALLVYEQPDTARTGDLVEEYLNAGSRVRMPRPLADCGMIPCTGGKDRGEACGSTAAIRTLGGVSIGEYSECQGVYQWPG